MSINSFRKFPLEFFLFHLNNLNFLTCKKFIYFLTLCSILSLPESSGFERFQEEIYNEKISVTHKKTAVDDELINNGISKEIGADEKSDFNSEIIDKYTISCSDLKEEYVPTCIESLNETISIAINMQLRYPNHFRIPKNSEFMDSFNDVKKTIQQHNDLLKSELPQPDETITHKKNFIFYYPKNHNPFYSEKTKFISFTKGAASPYYYETWEYKGLSFKITPFTYDQNMPTLEPKSGISHFDYPVVINDEIYIRGAYNKNTGCTAVRLHPLNKLNPILIFNPENTYPECNRNSAYEYGEKRKIIEELLLNSQTETGIIYGDNNTGKIEQCTFQKSPSNYCFNVVQESTLKSILFKMDNINKKNKMRN